MRGCCSAQMLACYMYLPLLSRGWEVGWGLSRLNGDHSLVAHGFPFAWLVG